MKQGEMARVKSDAYAARRPRTKPERDEAYEVTRHYVPGLYVQWDGEHFSVWDGRYVVRPYGPDAHPGWYRGALLLGYVVKAGRHWTAHTPENEALGVYKTRSAAAEECWKADVYR